ncbi:unnamed protein product [Schistocephalus solidus]|uniref:Reverse transcriptase domain-containing protein n=1 Tax=Schistocephalus solidus TaxID=70667 RepID=A0A183TKY4_SCHSO|nr:unnamed protein product [Schistocephalus solidus]
MAFGCSICLVQVVNAPVAVSNCYPALTCGSSKLGLPSGYTPGNRHDRRATPDLRPHSPQPLERSPGARTAPGKPMRLSTTQRNNRHDLRPEICIAYRMDGRLLNQRWMQFHSRFSTATIHELLFADNCALNTRTEEEMQRSMDLFTAACDNFGLRINTEKTVVMHQPSPNTLYAAAHINLNGAQIKSVDTFTYLGSNLSRST